MSQDEHYQDQAERQDALADLPKQELIDRLEAIIQLKPHVIIPGIFKSAAETYKDGWNNGIELAQYIATGG